MYVKNTSESLNNVKDGVIDREIIRSKP